MSKSVETRIVNNGSPFKRFAVVRVGGRKQQSFRAWFNTFAEAEEVANEYALGETKGLFVVMEVQAALGQKGEFERKLPDIEHNYINNVLVRRETSGQLSGTSQIRI